MRWVEISIQADAASEDAVANILIEEGCGGTASVSAGAVILSEAKNDDAVVVSGYLPVDDRLEGRLELIRERVRSLPELGLDLPSSEIGVTWVEDDNWVLAYRSFFKPIRLGRVVIKPSWEEFSPGSDDLIVEIDPGMAFGTGYHATTAMCLMALQGCIRGGETVLDVGTGSGILAIAAAKLGASRVVGIDSDPVATRVAAENIERNGLASVIDIRTTDSTLAFDGLADVVLANIIPKVILEMAADLCAKVKPGGKLITSGIILERAEEVKAALELLGLRTVEQHEQGEWVALVSESSVPGKVSDA